MNDQKNLILAIGLSLIIVLAYEAFFAPAPPPPPPTQTQTETQTQAPELVPGQQPAQPARPSAPEMPGADAPAAPPTAGGDGISVPTPSAAGAAAAAGSDARRAALAQSPRIAIEAPRIEGSISLRGARIDDITLREYGITPSPDSPRVALLSPPAAPAPYFARFGWTPALEGTPVPDGNTLWQADGEVLTAGDPLRLTWDNGEGLRFILTFRIDEGYMLTVTQRVENATGEAVTLYPYGLVSRWGTPDVTGFFILHEGPIGVLDGVLREIDYEDLRDDGMVRETSPGGWFGMTSKYWLTSLVPDQSEDVDVRFNHRLDGTVDKYQVDYLAPATIVPAGGSAEETGHLFAGAKVVDMLDAYGERLNIPEFDRAVDFGWFYFLTKPIFHALQWLNSWAGNFGIAILLLTVAIKALFFPLANKSYRAMSKMKLLQPEMMKIRDRYQNDKMRMNQEMMALYKREKANPAAGCLPIVIQIPVFFALYKVLFVSIEMRGAPFFGWINDLSAPDPTSIFNLFGLLPWTPPEWLPALGLWPLIMGATMFLQQRLNPQPPDPVQARIFMLMPFIFTVLLASFPAGLVIYWAWNNLLSIGQQWVIMKRMGST